MNPLVRQQMNPLVRRQMKTHVLISRHLRVKRVRLRMKRRDRTSQRPRAKLVRRRMRQHDRTKLHIRRPPTTKPHAHRPTSRIRGPRTGLLRRTFRRQRVPRRVGRQLRVRSQSRRWFRERRRPSSGCLINSANLRWPNIRDVRWSRSSGQISRRANRPAQCRTTSIRHTRDRCGHSRRRNSTVLRRSAASLSGTEVDRGSFPPSRQKPASRVGHPFLSCCHDSVSFLSPETGEQGGAPISFLLPWQCFVPLARNRRAGWGSRCRHINRLDVRCGDYPISRLSARRFFTGSVFKAARLNARYTARASGSFFSWARCLRTVAASPRTSGPLKAEAASPAR